MRQEQFEDLPKREKMSPAWTDWDRSTGLYMKGLHRKLESNVGRPWSKVYHELIEQIEAEFPQRCWDELRRQIFWYVEVSPMDLGNGIYMNNRGWMGFQYKTIRYLYVHPKTGLLCRPKKSWEKLFREYFESENPFKQEVRYIQNRCFRKMHGIWYEVELVSITNQMQKPYHPDSMWNRQVDGLWAKNLTDVVLKTRIWSNEFGSLAAVHGYRRSDGKLVSRDQYNARCESSREYNRKHGGIYMPPVAEVPVYARSLRQLSKAELRQLGLEESKLTVPNFVPKHKKKRK